MLQTVLAHLRSQWIGVLALFLVVAGSTAYAANTVFSGDIVNGEVKTVDLANRAVTMAKLALDSVDSDAVVDDSLGSRDLRNNAAVQSPDVRNESLTGADIAPESLTGGDIADGTVTGDDVTEETLWSGNIRDNSIHGVDIWNETLTGTDVAADSLSGADIAEGSLGTVPSARLGGIGRYGNNSYCDPDGAARLDCAAVTLNLPAPARVLLIAQVTAQPEDGSDGVNGTCDLVSEAGFLPASGVLVSSDSNDTFGMTFVTGVQAAGSHDYGVNCREFSSTYATFYRDIGVSAVALSAD